MSYRVSTESFEGPFDLLLYLVNRQKVDIGVISISAIIDQYLAEVSGMRNLDLDVASDFLLVAATLLEIKAQSLVGSDDEEETDEDLIELGPNEARNILVQRLLTYKKYKNVAGMLEGRFEHQSRMHPRTFGPDAQFCRRMPDFLQGVTLDALALLAVDAYSRRDIFLLESEHIAPKIIPVEIHVRALHQRIKNSKHMNFSDIVTKDTPNDLIVVSFLAILELYKRSMVTLVQEDTFGDISIDYIEGSGDLLLDDDHALTSVIEEEGSHV